MATRKSYPTLSPPVTPLPVTISDKLLKERKKGKKFFQSKKAFTKPDMNTERSHIPEIEFTDEIFKFENYKMNFPSFFFGEEKEAK